MHPNIVHLDDVEERVIDRGPLQGRRQRLGAAAGAHRIGVSRYVLGPGQRAMPVHVHADEEEHFYVVSGWGYSWQDGRVWRIGPGELVVHLAQGPAHAIIAGDEGLEVLAYGSGSETGITWLPHAQAWWLDPHWLPADGPDPFELEAQAGELELPDPETGPCPFIASPDSAEAEVSGRDGYHERYWRLAAAAGSQKAGLSLGILEPGSLPCPPHWHSSEEECFVVLDGEGEALLGDETHPVRAGHVMLRPPGTGVAHAFRAGPAGLTYLVYGTRVPGDYVYYPRSGKLNFGGGVIFRVQPVDYWDGE
jgi:uncharacterized cupin superfamily protein